MGAVSAAFEAEVKAKRAERVRTACDQALEILRGFNTQAQTSPDADLDENVRDLAALMRLKADELEKAL